MTPETWQRLKSIFHAALDLEPEERAAFLARVCDGDDQLRGRVEKLFLSNDDLGNFLVSPALVDAGLIDADDARTHQSPTRLGQRIGPYEIILEIGHGGMGTVFLAVRADDQYRKQVAIKVVNRGMDTDTILRRFVMERQILANLEHPNIARLLDGGTTSDGLPYFVMEYVEGQPIDGYCEERALSAAPRLELFREVCAALHYAHQNLVVHRDIKPSNILITSAGVPKLLDFGIAKLLSPDWAGLTGEVTASMVQLMTPAYASPEQLRGQSITTASDVYSLGVVLYELLTGQLPYRLNTRRPEEMAGFILSEEPERPSTAASRQLSEGKQRGNENLEPRTTGAERLTNRTNPQSAILNPKSLRGDLDNIVLKALRKEPERRYASVQEFAEDIRRHLDGLPVTASPDTLSYRARKFLHRHRAAVAAAVIVVAMLLAATAITSWQARVARRERDRAERRFNESRKIANSLLFEIHDSMANLSGATASRELLVKRALEYLNTLSQEAENNPELLKELSVAYRKLGDIQGAPYDSNLGQSSGAMVSYQKALEMQESLLEANPRDIEMQKQLGKTALQIADSYYSRGHYEGALKYYRRSQSAYEIVSAFEPQESLWKTRLALLYVRSDSALGTMGKQSAEMDDLKAARKFNEEALAIAPEDSTVLISCAYIYSYIGNNLGNPDYNAEGKVDEASEVLQSALSIRQKLADREPGNNVYQNNLGISLKDIGDIYLAKGQAEKAIENYDKALAIHQAIADKDAQDANAQGTAAYDLTKLGNALLANGEIDNALARHEQSVEVLERMHLADAGNVMVAHTFALSLEGFADGFRAKKDYAKALTVYQRSLRIEEEINSNSETPEIQIKIAQLYFKLGQTRQVIFTSKGANNSLCQDFQRDFQKSVDTFTEIQKRTALGPPNLEILSQARQFAEKSRLSKENQGGC